jgi:hypothetical protein
MSRDTFSHDPQDSRESVPERTGRQHRSTPSGAETPDRGAEPSDPREGSRVQEQTSTRDERSDSSRPYYVRDRTYVLSGSEIHSLAEIGKFRIIATADLARFAYGGNRERTDKDIRRLARNGLLTDNTVEVSRKKTLRIVTLTKHGHRLLKKAGQLPGDQVIYHGLRKPREVKHDADLYPLYQKEASGIERGGGRLVRVILDYELKRNLNRDLAWLGTEKDNPGRKAEVAAKHGLKVVDGKIPVPDLRVEYETAQLEPRHVNLELATRDYRPRALVAKAKAGFSLYSCSEDASGLRRVLDAREITAGIHLL